MKIRITRLIRSCASVLLLASTAFAETAAKAPSYKAAIFVSNRSGPAQDDKIAALEDFVTSRVTDAGISVISRETVLNAVAHLSPNAKANEIDSTLADNTSALRLSQTLGADYLLQVTLAGYDSKSRTIDAYGVNAVNEERTLRVSYKILDGNTGASLTGDTIKAAKLYQQSAASKENYSDSLNELLDEASQKVALSLRTRIDQGRITAPSAAQGLVTIKLTTEAADLAIPDVRIGVENTVSISESKFKVSPLAATVEVDGISVGTAPGSLQVKAGLSKIRVVREGFKPYERTVNFINGQTLNIALVMSEEGYTRWKESTQFLNDLKNKAKLTDGEVKVLEGQAKMFEQSGYKVDIKVDTHDGIKIDNRSLFGF